MTILGMIATYGVVCGAMMFAGEHEGGTLVFLDIFQGRRDSLWFGKFAIGAILVAAEGLAVAAILVWMNQLPPAWIQSIAGIGEGAFRAARDDDPGRQLWFLVLPILALEAYFWGLLGSSLLRRVLPAAAIGAVGITPLFLFTIVAPPIVAIPIRLIAAAILLCISYWQFINQSREGSDRPTPKPPPLKAASDARDRFLDLWDLYEQADNRAKKQATTGAPILRPLEANPRPTEPAPTKPEVPLSRKDTRDADSPTQVLWWLAMEQGKELFAVMTAICLIVGFFMPINPRVLWPLATLLLGVACGTAAFAAEQRDLSYQFLAAQHLPLKSIQRFKLAFWFGAGLVDMFVLAIGSFFIRIQPPQAVLLADSTNILREMLGPISYHLNWFPYGFCAGQIFVWLCRKYILALLISSMVAFGAIGLWLPAVLCGGLSGWQIWAPPLLMLAATWRLVRAWAGGRIWERKPIAALVGFGVVILAWVCVVHAHRAWSVPDVDEPLDRIAFRATLPDGREQDAAKAIRQAIGQLDDKNGIAWREHIKDAARLPTGVLEIPRGDGQTPILGHLKGCDAILLELTFDDPNADTDGAFDSLFQSLAITRTLRNKAPLKSYLSGMAWEKSTLDAIDARLPRAKPTPKLLRRIVDELDRHASETPPPLDCLETECFRSGGLQANPISWSFAQPGRLIERWPIGGIAFSLDTPGESERKTRIWRLVWDGLFRGMKTPHWQMPKQAELPIRPRKSVTRIILDGWISSETGISRDEMDRLLDASWLADGSLFPVAASLRESATRARWRVDLLRLTTALALYEMEEKKPAEKLRDLVPKYLRELPTDPYSGESFRYRVVPEGQADDIGRPGQGVVWSTGPDRVDHGGKKQGADLRDNAVEWGGGEFDLIGLVPFWRKDQ